VSHSTAGLCSFNARALLAADGQRLPMDVAGASQTEGDHPGAGRLVREAVDQDEGAGIAIGGVGVERHRRRGRQIAEPDLVEAQGLSARCAKVSTLIRCFSAVTVAGTVRVPIFKR
jgi:hypothetical protein